MGEQSEKSNSSDNSATDDNRRLGPNDRRKPSPSERRNEDRVADDFAPRRDPNQPDRRSTEG